MPDIFISYSRKNKEFVQRVYGALAEQKRDIWVDWEDIPLTSDWWNEICTGIESSNSVVVVMTPESMGSPICAMEIDHAIRHGKRLIPLVREMADEKISFAAMAARELDDNAKKALGERQILDLAKQNWNALARHNWLFFKDDAEFDATFLQLVSAIDTDLDHVKQHTRLLMRAREWENKGKDGSYLLSGTDIADAEKWLAQNVAKQPTPLPLHAQYIGASRAAANRRQRMLLVGVSVAFVISLALTVLSFVLFRQSEASRELADFNAATAVAAQATAERRADESGSVALAQSANAVARLNPFLAYALAIDAASIDNPPPMAQEALGDAADINAIRSFPGHQGYIISIVFSPDGESAYSTAGDGQIIKWNLQTNEIMDTLIGGYNNLTVFSPDARYVVLQTEDYALDVVDLATHETLYTLREHDTFIAWAAFSGDGRYLISGSGTEYVEDDSIYNVVVWDMETQEVVQRMDGLTDPVNLVNLNSDGSLGLIATYGDDVDNIYLWDVATGEILKTLENYDVISVSFNPDSSEIWVNTQNGGMSIWATETEDLLFNSVDLSISTNFVFAPDGSYLAVGDDLSKSIQMWDGESYAILYNYFGHDIYVNAIAISPDERYLLSGDNNGVLILWDLQAFRDLEFFTPYITPNIDSQIATDGETLVWIEANGYATYSSREVALSYGIFEGLTRVAISPDVQSIVFGASDGTIRSADLSQDEFEPVDFNALESSITAIIFSADSATVFTGAEDGSLVSWDYATGDEITRIVEQGSAITTLATNPDGLTILSGHRDGSVNVYDLETGEVVVNFVGHSDPITSAVYSDDGHYILTGDSRGTVILWDVATSAIVHTLDGQRLLAATSVAFSPDGTSMAAGFDNGALMVWEVGSGDLLRTYLAHTRTITSIQFSSNSLGVRSISTDGSHANHIIETVPHMIDWLYNNRDVPVLTCAQRLQYNAHILCDDSGSFPTATPYPTLTPTPLP